jgi:hypothetical protein
VSVKERYEAVPGGVQVTREEASAVSSASEPVPEPVPVDSSVASDLLKDHLS